MRIYSAYELATAAFKHLRKQFSFNVERTITELNGVSVIPLTVKLFSCRIVHALPYHLYRQALINKMSFL